MKKTIIPSVKERALELAQKLEWFGRERVSEMDLNAIEQALIQAQIDILKDKGGTL